MNKIHNIQFLRAVAALMVVLFHIYPHIESVDSLFYPLLYFFGQVGYVGVDLFFVISGFVIWFSSQNNRSKLSVNKFIYSRLTRIYLGYWPFFLIYLALVYRFLPSSLENVDLVGSFFLSQTNVFELLLPVAWTLVFELYFYICFAILLLLPRHWMKKTMVLLIAIIVVIQGYQIIINDMYDTQVFPQSSIYLTFISSPFCLEFLIGCLIACYFENHRIKNLTPWLVLAISVFLTGCYYQKTFIEAGGLLSQGYYLPERVLFFGTFSAIVIALLVELNFRGVVLIKSVSSLVGSASYSIYLSHIPWLLIFSYFGFFEYVKAGSLSLVLSLMIVLCCIISYSLIHYFVVEKPLLKWSKKLYSNFFN